MTGMEILQVKDLCKHYPAGRGKEPVKAVDGVSFSVRQGEIFGLLGPNGAGKTTTIKSVCGLIIPDAGEVRVAGFDIFKQRAKALEHISAVLEGNRNLYWRLTARENLEYFTGIRGFSRRQVKEKIEWLLEFFGLQEKEHTVVNKLSRGMQQKLAIATAMACNTDLVLLDEPTLGLDVETSFEVRQLLRRITAEQGKTIILSTHDMNVVQEVCERVLVINKGRVVAQGRVENLLRLFESKEYRFRLGGFLTEAQCSKLKKLCPEAEVVPQNRGCWLRIPKMEGQIVYDVIDVLKSEGTHIEGIEHSNTDFEDVFLKIIRSDEDAVSEPFSRKLS